MSDSKKSIYGTIGWFDLTVPNATEVKDFYAKVTEWKPAVCCAFIKFDTCLPLKSYTTIDTKSSTGRPYFNI